MSNSNIGWKYYKAYYKEFDFQRSGETQREEIKTYQSGFFEDKNKELFQSHLTEESVKVLKYDSHSFEIIPLETIYPGLATGTGLMHETGSMGESKLGFAFDHTSGLPYIPASSVKGCLRSVFPQYVNEQKSSKLDNEDQEASKEYMKYLLCQVLNCEIEQLEEKRIEGLQKIGIPADKIEKVDQDFVDLLEWEIFEGITLQWDEANKSITYTPKSIYQRDIFLDAYPSEAKDSNGVFLGPDFITPHVHRRDSALSPFTNPIPIMFMKILPRVVIIFQFDLKEGILPVDLKKELFKYILLQIGIGAKTNVGYGQFREPEKPRVFEEGEIIKAKIIDIYYSDNRIEVELEEVNLTIGTQVKKSKLMGRGSYQIGEIYDFKVSSVDGKGNIKHIKSHG